LGANTRAIALNSTYIFAADYTRTSPIYAYPKDGKTEGYYVSGGSYIVDLAADETRVYWTEDGDPDTSRSRDVRSVNADGTNYAIHHYHRDDPSGPDLNYVVLGIGVDDSWGYFAEWQQDADTTRVWRYSLTGTST